MSYVLFFLGALWYTLGSVVICGLCVSLFRTLFLRMMGNGVGRGAVMATSILGTPVHELGHAAMCLLFGHKITAMSLWQPASKDDRLGFVTHSYHARNPYHILGNLFIGIGPIFSGLGVLTLAFWLGFPDTFADYTAAASSMAAGGDGGFLLFLEGIKMLPRMLEELIHGSTVPLWGRIIALLVILAVSQHISLSLEDVKGALTAIPLYLALILLLTVICGLLGQGAMNTVMSVLSLFSAYLTALFVIVLVSALLQLLIALPVWGVRMLIRR
ncbi:MAG: hypothetical protein IJX72_01465 [Clostridia bacterium]|nr:hypothetical protein [Clostridia bacterium]